MNKRIHELAIIAIKSGYIVGQLPLNTNEKILLAGLEKFAKMIVRECALTLYKNAVQDKQAGFAHEAKIMELAGDIINQHFGVE